VDWNNDFYYPFVKKWSEMVRTVVGQDKLIFTEAIPNEVYYSPTTITVVC
jgi:hypothetical protein